MTNSNQPHKSGQPPKWVHRLLERFCNPKILEAIEGDLLELFERRLQEKGLRWARYAYVWDALGFVRPFALKKRKKQRINPIDMFRNYFKTAFRNLFRYRFYSLANIMGLAMGLACFTVILLYIQDELKYDQFHQDPERIYRVIKDFVNDDGTALPDATTPPALAPAIARELPEVEQSTRVFPSWGYKPLLSYQDQSFYEENFLRVDSTFFNIFNFEFVEGQAENCFEKPRFIILTERLAQKYFGQENPIGKTLTFDKRADFTVCGLVKNPPTQSHLQFDFLISVRTLGTDFQNNYTIDNNWGWYNYYTYVKFQENTSPEIAEGKIIDLFKKYNPDATARYYIQPVAGMDGIHLASNLKWELQPNSDKKYIYIFGLIALFVIFIAGINYVNLTTARSATRAKEVGIRKVAGAERSMLVKQFLSESLLLSFIALGASLGLVQLALPFFNSATQKHLYLFPMETSIILPILLLVTLLYGLLSGLYPAFHLSRFAPQRVLKDLSVKGGGAWLRKSLVVFQFSLSVALIIGVLVINDQMTFLQKSRLGFDQEQILVIRNLGSLNRGQADFLQNELNQTPGVALAASANGMLGGQNWTRTVRPKDREEGTLLNYIVTDYDYIDLMGLELKEGRAFSDQFPRDTIDAIILNEQAVKDLGLEGPAEGQQIIWAEDSQQDTIYYARIVGVVKDFHFASLHNEIKPFGFVVSNNNLGLMALKTKGKDLTQTLAGIEQTWQRIVPDRPFDYYFLDESIGNLYRFESNFRTIFSTMTGLGILIACLGLFGLAAFMIEQRTKEIGIRKVLGASIFSIVNLLSVDFLKLIFYSLLIATPFAWYFMNRWLDNFAYRTEIEWWMFLLAGAAAVLIAALTVCFQSIKAAVANPLDALRRE